MILLSEGKLISNNLECLKDVIDAAKIFDICYQAWSVYVEERESEENDLELEKFIDEPFAKHEFSNLDWEDCEFNENLKLSNLCVSNGIAIYEEVQESSTADQNLMVEPRRIKGKPKKILIGSFECEKCGISITFLVFSIMFLVFMRNLLRKSKIQGGLKIINP